MSEVSENTEQTAILRKIVLNEHFEDQANAQNHQWFTAILKNGHVAIIFGQVQVRKLLKIDNKMQKIVKNRQQNAEIF